MSCFFRPVGLPIASLLVFCAFATAQETYFPKNALADDSRSDQFKTYWYSHALKVLAEPSLLELAKNSSSESYRFLWLRTFHHPVAIRLDVRPDGTGALTKKVGSGSAGFPYTVRLVIENVSRPLTREQTQGFLAMLIRLGFWSLPSHINDQTGTDGSQWVIEGVKEGKYHVVDRWSPDAGAVRELGLSLALEMAYMNVPKDELY